MVAIDLSYLTWSWEDVIFKEVTQRGKRSYLQMINSSLQQPQSAPTDLFETFTYADAKLKGFAAACSVPIAVSAPKPELNQEQGTAAAIVPDQQRYLLACGLGIKNVHIWELTISSPSPSSSNAASSTSARRDSWRCIYDVASNGNTITHMQFRQHHRVDRDYFELLTKSSNVNLRVWDLSEYLTLSNKQHQQQPQLPAEQSAGQPAAQPGGQPGGQLYAKPAYEDIANTQDVKCLCESSAFAYGGIYNFAMMNVQSSTVIPKEINRNVLDLPEMTTALDGSTAAAAMEEGGTTRRRVNREVVEVVASQCGEHVMILCTDGGLLHFQLQVEQQQQAAVSKGEDNKENTADEEQQKQHQLLLNKWAKKQEESAGEEEESEEEENDEEGEDASNVSEDTKKNKKRRSMSSAPSSIGILQELFLPAASITTAGSIVAASPAMAANSDTSSSNSLTPQQQAWCMKRIGAEGIVVLAHTHLTAANGSSNGNSSGNGSLHVSITPLVYCTSQRGQQNITTMDYTNQAKAMSKMMMATMSATPASVGSKKIGAAAMTTVVEERWLAKIQQWHPTGSYYRSSLIPQVDTTAADADAAANGEAAATTTGGQHPPHLQRMMSYHQDDLDQVASDPTGALMLPSGLVTISSVNSKQSPAGVASVGVFHSADPTSNKKRKGGAAAATGTTASAVQPPSMSRQTSNNTTSSGHYATKKDIHALFEDAAKAAGMISSIATTAATAPAAAKRAYHKGGRQQQLSTSLREPLEQTEGDEEGDEGTEYLQDLAYPPITLRKTIAAKKKPASSNTADLAASAATVAPATALLTNSPAYENFHQTMSTLWQAFAMQFVASNYPSDCFHPLSCANNAGQLGYYSTLQVGKILQEQEMMKQQYVTSLHHLLFQTDGGILPTMLLPWYEMNHQADSILATTPSTLATTGVRTVADLDSVWAARFLASIQAHLHKHQTFIQREELARQRLEWEASLARDRIHQIDYHHHQQRAGNASRQLIYRYYDLWEKTEMLMRQMMEVCQGIPTIAAGVASATGIEARMVTEDPLTTVV